MYCDVDYYSDLDKKRSLIGYLYTLFSNMISWNVSLQLVIRAFSTTKVEYIALTETVKEALWLKGMLKEFGVEQSVDIFCDN